MPSWIVALVLTLVAAAAFAEPVPPSLAKLGCAKCDAIDNVRVRFDDNEWKQLTAGAIVTKDRAKDVDGADQKREAEAYGVVPWPPSAVWDVLVDFEARPKWLKTSTESTILKVDDSHVYVRQRLSILWEDIGFGVINTVNPEKGLITWVLNPDIPHDIADTSGAWQVVPMDNGAHTLVMYRSHTDTGRAVPAVIEKFVMKQSLPKMIDSLRGETAKRGKNSRYLLPESGSEEKKR